MSVTIDPKAPIKELRPIDTSKPTTIEEALVLLNSNPRDFEKDIAKLPNMQVGGEGSDEWVNAVRKGFEHLLNGDVFRSRLEDIGSDWTNRPTFEDKPITAARLKQGNSTGIVSGEAAVMKVKARLGLGSIMPIPLWHTGGWITLKAPSNAAIFELNRRIAQEKITLGRMTNGMVFSNTGIYIQSYLINFVLAHVYDTTLGTKDPEELKKIILSTDLPSLVWGMVCTMYPDGYELREPCVAQITKCNHISSGKVNIARLRVVDTSKLTEAQLKHMSRRNGTHSETEIETYQEAFTYRNQRFEIEGADGMGLELSVPTLADYEQVGFNWVDSVVNMVDAAFRVPLKGDARNTYITEQGRLAALRQFSHWIKTIDLDADSEDTDMVVDRETIDSICSEFSADETIRTSVLNGIGKFIEESTIAVIGYPNTECPSCGLRYGDHVEEAKEKGGTDTIVRGEHIPEFIPLDLTTTFFTLCEQRIQPAVLKPL